METIIDLIANYGIGMACVGYMIYFQSTTMKDMTKTQEAVLRALEGLSHRLELIEIKIDRKDDSK